MRNQFLAVTLALGAATGGWQPALAAPAPLAQVSPQTQPLRIVIDAGHGGADKGIVSANLVEKDLSLSLSLKLKDELERQGVQVTLTRAANKFVALRDRVEVTAKANPNYFISLHFRESAKFTSSHEVSYKNANSKALAIGLQQHLQSDFPAFKVPAQSRNFHVVREVSVPAVMVSADITAFANPQAQDQLARSLASGLIGFAPSEAKNK